MDAKQMGGFIMSVTHCAGFYLLWIEKVSVIEALAITATGMIAAFVIGLIDIFGVWEIDED